MPDRTPYTALIEEVADVYALPAPVLEAQILVESGGDANALRYEHDFFVRYIKDNPAAKGAVYGPLAACSYGLLQVMLETMLELGFPGRPEDLFTPRTNLVWAGKYLADLVRWAGGDLERALCAFNGGKQATMTKPYRNALYAQRVAALVRPGPVNS